MPSSRARCSTTPGFAAREEDHLDPGALDQLEAVPVADVETLGLLPVVADDDPAVGEHPVHVENEDLYLPDLLNQICSV